MSGFDDRCEAAREGLYSNFDHGAQSYIDGPAELRAEFLLNSSPVAGAIWDVIEALPFTLRASFEDLVAEWGRVDEDEEGSW